MFSTLISTLALAATLTTAAILPANTTAVLSNSTLPLAGALQASANTYVTSIVKVTITTCPVGHTLYAANNTSSSTVLTTPSVITTSYTTPTTVSFAPGAFANFGGSGATAPYPAGNTTVHVNGTSAFASLPKATALQSLSSSSAKSSQAAGAAGAATAGGITAPAGVSTATEYSGAATATVVSSTTVSPFAGSAARGAAEVMPGSAWLAAGAAGLFLVLV